MSDKTSIEWTATVHPDGSVTPGATWNPVTGCSKVSPGCAHCYAERLAPKVFAGQTVAVLSEDEGGLSHTPRKRVFTDVRCHEKRLKEPLSWWKPRRVFVNSMSDLFHEDIPDAFIDRVFAVMALAPKHTFQILTKRAERMRSYMISRAQDPRYWNDAAAKGLGRDIWLDINDLPPVVLPNVWLGVSVENQHFADERIPLLLQTPAAVRFLSLEPLLEQVDLTNYLWTIPGARLNGLHWLIVGGESGTSSRPFDVAWARWTVAQGRSAGVPVFVKQLGAKPFGSCTPEGCSIAPHSMKFKHKKSGDPSEWPSDLRVREFPNAV